MVVCARRCRRLDLDVVVVVVVEIQTGRERERLEGWLKNGYELTMTFRVFLLCFAY